MSIVTKESNPDLYNSLFEDATIEDTKKVMQNMFNDITPGKFEELKKQAMENVKKNNMSAKEMFEKLGYVIDIDCLGILRYAKHDTNYNIDYYIKFFNDLKEISCNKIEENELSILDIDLNLLQAINKQVEELSWNEK